MKGTLQNIQLDLKWLYMHWENAGGGQGAQIGFFQAAASLPHCLLDNFGWIKFATKFHVKILQKSYKIPPFSLLRKHPRFQKEGIFGDRRGGRERGGVGAGRDGAGRVLGRRAGYHDGGRGYKRARCEGGAARGGWRSAFGARRGQKRSIRASADFTQIQIILSWGALMWPYKQMLKTSLLIVLLLLVGQTLAQDLQLSEEQLKDTALLTELNNYFGCKVWSESSCLQCSERFFFNKNGVCCEVQGTCQQFNTQEGICEKCYEGYAVVDGKCAKVDKTTTSNVGCAIWNNGVCTQCSKRWFFNADKVCAPVSDLCSSWDENGACTECYYGYIVNSGACVENNDVSVVPNSNLLCRTWKGQTCIECADRTYFNENGICSSVSSQCNTFDKATGACLSCFAGYDVVDGACVYSPANTAHPADLGCGSWDWKNQVCLACSKRWAFNENKVCVPVADQCASNDETGNCASCFKGYDLKDGVCLYSDSNNAKPADSGCGTWDWDNQKCLSCSNGWVFNSNNVCTPVSDQCASHDSTGACLTCFKGYDLKEGACVFSDSNNAKPSDSGCGTWDWDNQKCLACSKGWFANADGACVPVSDQCASSNSAGNCLTCFKGYDLKDGACLFSEFNNAHPSDSGCATWDWDNQKCLSCSKNWVFNAEGVCTPVADQCASHDENGACLTCFKGYDLKDGACVFSPHNNAKPSDSGCATWDWDNQVCLACSKDWVFNADKVCVPVSDQCASSDSTGACLSCFKGYDLKEGKCIFSDFNNAKPADSGCATWDWDNQKCLSCSFGWVFNENNVCVPVSDQCATHDEKGNCLTCFKGYDVKNGVCIFSDSNNAKPSDSGCGTWDWDNQKCLSCSKGWVFNADGACVPVSDQCASSDSTGACLSCFKGYDLKDGACVFSAFNNAKPSDSGCATWDWDNQKCLSCSKNWVFNVDGACVPVSDHCASHDEKGACLTCFKGYDLKEGACVFSASNNAKPADSGCGTWDWDNQKCLACSKNWVFNSNGVCVPVSDQCASSDSTGACLTCFKGYDLKDGACVFSASNNAKPSDSGCATWDWDNQVCLACSKHWVFNSNKVCVPVSDQCASHDDSGACLSCFKGYDLKDGACVFSASNNAKPSDSGCGTWDWDNQKCLSCSKGWFFNTNQVCTPISDQCASADEKGACLTCFSGYDLKDGACLFSEFNNAHPADIGCASWDWKNQKCLACSKRWFFNSHKTCVPVDDNCNTHDENGACTSCYQGYAVNSGVCVSVNPLCRTLNADGTCATCYPQNVLHNGSCVPINKLANILLYYAACCPEKLAALQASQKSN